MTEMALNIVSKVFVVSSEINGDPQVYIVATSVEVAKELVRGFVEVHYHNQPIEWVEEDGDVGGKIREGFFTIEERDLVTAAGN